MNDVWLLLFTGGPGTGSTCITLLSDLVYLRTNNRDNRLNAFVTQGNIEGCMPRKKAGTMPACNSSITENGSQRRHPDHNGRPVFSPEYPPQQVDPIIAKILAAGAAFSGDSRLQGACAHWGAPAKPDQNLTSGEFRKQHEIVIASCKSCGEMDCRVVINATVGLTVKNILGERPIVSPEIASVLLFLANPVQPDTVYTPGHSLSGPTMLKES